MERARQVPPEVSSQESTISPGVLITPREFFWLTLAVWMGGIFILTLLPYVLVPRVGGPLAVAGSYFVFFLAWQPVQSITQRTLGTKAAFVRMLIFVIGAATVAAIFRQSLSTITG
jgi:hypothetical protein